MGGETCSFLAADFDGAGWRADAQAFLRNCDELGVPAARMPHSDNFLILTIFQTVKPKPVLVIQTVA
ncbi:TOTE conflict system archaeo-eukaryotic primase domain-containing protein [Desulfonatronum thioautotrophicum]|uniref:TOTE conflict system archaeo-eukaryotic primase domain-containing protein n=1 Tax=Desulfonatronum thioautotrophicum TaxID=617001 RepID=UPI003EBD7EED